MNKQIRSILFGLRDFSPTLSERAYQTCLAALLGGGLLLFYYALRQPPELPHTAPAEPQATALFADAKADAEARKRAEATWEKELKWREEANREARENWKRLEQEKMKLPKRRLH